MFSKKLISIHSCPSTSNTYFVTSDHELVKVCLRVFLLFRVTPNWDLCPTSWVASSLLNFSRESHLALRQLKVQPVLSSVPHSYAMTQQWELCSPAHSSLPLKQEQMGKCPTSPGDAASKIKHNRARPWKKGRGQCWGQRARHPSMSQMTH